MSIYYPKAHTSFGPPFKMDPPIRPTDVASVFDKLSLTPLEGYRQPTIEKPDGFCGYLQPTLARNERLRLTTLWYYTRDMDEEILWRMQEKVNLVKEYIGWDFAICGLLDNAVYKRVAAVGLPLAHIARRESPCSHTIQHDPEHVFLLPDMTCDWRFAKSPQVVQGGLQSYAGAQLQCHVGDETVALGSLCVASSTPRDLTRRQQEVLKQFAEMLTADIVNGSRRKRAAARESYNALLKDAEDEAAILQVLHTVYPAATISMDDHPGTEIWEDNALIEKLIQMSNHEKLVCSTPVRAITGNAGATTIVVSTNDITYIFDDIDVRFVKNCALTIHGLRQEALLQQALATRSRFLRGITHQLRTPIHGILGSVELLEDTEDLKMIKHSGLELISIVNNIIKFSHWNDTVSRTLTDLRLLEASILEDLAWFLPEGRLDALAIIFNNELADIAVMIDAVRLKDCIQALVLNALQNTSKGSVVITVTCQGSLLVFDVQDTGCGIAEADHQKIFEPFEKCNPHTKGAGLGLTLALKFAESMGGRVILVSSSPRGSHFRAEFETTFCCCRKPDERRWQSILGNDNDGSLVDDLVRSLEVQALNRGVAMPFKAELNGNVLSWSGWRVDGPAECIAGSDAGSNAELNAGSIAESIAESNAGSHAGLPTGSHAGSDVSLPANPAKSSTVDFVIPTEMRERLYFSGPFTTDCLDNIINTIASRASPVEKTPTPVERRALSECLLVDDNAINLRILCQFCKKRGLQYRTAVNGRLAVEAYIAKPTSLILLDLQMPECDGIDACKAIRAHELENQLTPALIYIITGQDSPSDRANAFEAGADKFYVRPLALKELEKGIAEYFGPG